MTNYNDTMPMQRAILVVDDNRDAADSLAKLLRVMGHTVVVAYDGESGIALCDTFEPEVFILDIGLPGISGHEVAAQLRGRDGGSKILLIAVTGWGQAADRERSKEAGFDHHLVKPVGINDLTSLFSDAPKASAS